MEEITNFVGDAVDDHRIKLRCRCVGDARSWRGNRQSMRARIEEGERH